MALLGIDLGSTHLKAGVFSEDGRPLAVARRPTPVRRSPAGYDYFEPDVFTATALEAVEEAVNQAGQPVEAAGIASMAESGLFIDRRSGAALTPFLPWFDTSAAAQAERLALRGTGRMRFLQAGIRPSFKVSLARILWLVENGFSPDPATAVWLSAADYLLHRLTGSLATDPSLACRTYAYRLDTDQWNDSVLQENGLDSRLFPPVLPAGAMAGRVRGMGRSSLMEGLPVAVCGHDHVCASFAAGLLQPGIVFDSMGTAESLMGLLAHASLGEAEFQSGLSFGCHVLPGRVYWLGGLSTSGGAVDWLRRLISDPPPDFADLDALLAGGLHPPGNLLFLPYLEGSGSPHTDQSLRGAFLGLDRAHTLADLYQAMLAGASCEMEIIREAGERVTGAASEMIIAAGGGASSRPWLEIKANLSGCPVIRYPVQEATLLGAALLAGVGSQIYPDHAAALASLNLPPGEVIQPDPARQRDFVRLARAYRAAQEPYRRLSREARLAGNP